MEKFYIAPRPASVCRRRRHRLQSQIHCMDRALVEDPNRIQLIVSTALSAHALSTCHQVLCLLDDWCKPGKLRHYGGSVRRSRSIEGD